MTLYKIIKKNFEKIIFSLFFEIFFSSGKSFLTNMESNLLATMVELPIFNW